MRNLVIILILLVSNLVLSAEVKKDPERNKKLLTLINSEIKTIADNTYASADLTHRLFELYIERIKLVREIETDEMLKDDVINVKKYGKEHYYKKSIEQYLKTQQYGLNFIKNNPQYNKIAEVYYSMAINSRDFGTNKETEGFLLLAIKHSKENSKTLKNAKISLAEYYYNEKKYAEASTYYEEIIKNKSDEWYGKHLYNAAWCHLKEKNFNRALELIKESFETTKDKKYVDMKEQILNAIGIFFVQANQTKDAIGFYEKNTKPSYNYLLMLANASLDKSNFSTTDEVLRSALKDTQNRKDVNSELKVRIAMLDIYRELQKEDYYFNASQSIIDLYKKNKKLPAEDIANVVNKLKDISGYLQINLAKDVKKDAINYNKESYSRVLKYFDFLTVLDKANKNQYRYYQGETALSVKDERNAAKFYVRSIVTAKQNKLNDEFLRKSLEALLLILDDLEINAKTKNQYVIFTYKNFLIHYPVGEKSESLYQKLFSKYFELKKTTKATHVLLVYKQNYPNSEKVHREMVTQLLDHYIKRKSIDMIAAWVMSIEKGYLNFEQNYVQNSIAILGGLLFDKYQGLEKNKKIKEALQGYEDIFESKLYPNKIKAQAAYAIASVQMDLNNSKKSYKWLKKSLDIYQTKDLAEISASLLVLNKNFRLIQNFETSIELSNRIINTFCSNELKNKDDFYELLVITDLLQNKSISKTIGFLNDAPKCGIKNETVLKLTDIVFEMLIDNNDYKSIIAFAKEKELTKNSQKTLGSYLKFKFFEAPRLYQEDLKIINLKYTNLSLEPLVKKYELIEAFNKKLSDFKVELTVEEKFNAEKYNSELEQYLSMINEFSKEANLLTKDAFAEEIIFSRKNLIQPIKKLTNAINSYTPNGVDNKYLQGFKAGMRQVSESLLAKLSQIENENRQFLVKNNYFFEIEKHAKFDLQTSEATTSLLNEHKAEAYSSTLDLTKALN